MKKNIITKELLKIYKSKKYTNLRNINKYNKIEDLKEFYSNKNLDYEILREFPEKYLISVIQDYVLIRNLNVKLGDTHVIESFDDVFKACYLLDDFLFTMRIDGFKTFYSTIFCYYMEDIERLFEAIKEFGLVECLREVNKITGYYKLEKKEIIDRLINKDRVIDIEKLSIDDQDKIFYFKKKILRLSENAKINLLKYVKNEIEKSGH